MSFFRAVKRASAKQRSFFSWQAIRFSAVFLLNTMGTGAGGIWFKIPSIKSLGQWRTVSKTFQ